MKRLMIIKIVILFAFLTGCSEYPIINMDANPFTPARWSIVSHVKTGMLELNPEKISLYLPEKQKTGIIEGNGLRDELANQPILNANALDYLLAHPELIPEEWKGKRIFFWGTIYCNFDGILGVRCLGWDGSRWGWYYGWLDGGFDSNDPAALAIKV